MPSVAEIARTAFSPGAGVAAALLLALLPDDIILTTRVLSDGPLRMFLAIACLLILSEDGRTESDRAFGYAGLAMGLTYLTKIVGIPLFLMLRNRLAIEGVRRRSPRALVLYTLGFAARLAGAETIWLWWQTGEWFLHYRVVSSSIEYKLVFESHVFRHEDLGGYLRVMWEGEFLWFAPCDTRETTRADLHGLSGFGVSGWIWLAGLLGWSCARRRLGARILAGMAIGLYLFVELFPVDVRLTDQGGSNTSSVTYRNWRYVSADHRCL